MFFFIVTLGLESIQAQAPANDARYAFGKKIFQFFKEQKIDLIIGAIDPKAQDNVKQSISTSILNGMEKLKTIGDPARMKIINVLVVNSRNKLLIPVLTDKNDIIMIILDNVINRGGGLFLAGPVHVVRSEKEKRLTQARKIYMAKCFSCHGQYGEGMVGPNLTDDYWKYAKTDAEVKDVIANGRKGTVMIAFKDYLSAQEINDLMLYISILQGQRLRKGKPAEGNQVRLLRNLYLR